MPLISSLNSQVSSAICECRLEKLSSILDSITVNLSKSIFIERCVLVCWSSSISLLLSLFRFGDGFEEELELDDRFDHFDMRTSNELKLFCLSRSSDVRWTSLISLESSKMNRCGFSRLRNHRPRRARPTAMIFNLHFSALVLINCVRDMQTTEF